MLTFAFRKLLTLVGTMIGIAALTFLITNVAPGDPARLVAVQHELAVLALQAEADALRDPEREPGTHEDQDPEGRSTR